MSEYVLVPKNLLDEETLEKVDEYDVLPKIKERMAQLDNYLNSKELNELQSYIGAIESGESGVLHMVAFLELVPIGKFDSDRRHWQDVVMKRHKELESE